MKRRHSRLIAMLTTGEPKPSKRTPKKAAKSKVSPEHVHTFVASLMGEHMHAKRVLSLASGVVGMMHSAALGVRAIGLGLAEVVGLEKKHAVKQVDRLLSNRGIDVWEEFAVWVPYLIGARTDAD